KSRTFAALTTRRSINASLDVKRLNSAVSTFSQFDLMIFDVMISESTLRKSAYMASMDIALTLFVNRFVLTISSIMAFCTKICAALIPFEPIMSDVMTLDVRMFVRDSAMFALTALMLMLSICPLTFRLPVRFILSVIMSTAVGLTEMIDANVDEPMDCEPIKTRSD